VVLAIVIVIAKALAAFGATIAVARLFAKPILHFIAHSKNEEIFTATALLIALAAGWGTGAIGLSSTLGAFLGGLALAETPFRALISTEVKPFRGLLLGFFFVSVGLSLNVTTIVEYWPAILASLFGLIVIKLGTNVAASLVFKWSVPGSTQLGFLLAQGSEFAFLIFSLSPVRDLIGEAAASILVAVVALSMIATPSLAEAGRWIAGNLRRRARKPSSHAHELVPRTTTAQILIVGMGRVGRTVADALNEFEIPYAAVERDERRLREAIADGYDATFGDTNDTRLWSSVELHDRRMSVITAPEPETLIHTSEVARRSYPHLRRFAVVGEAAFAERLEEFGVIPVLDDGSEAGSSFMPRILTELGVSPSKIEEWMKRRKLRGEDEKLKAA
jgi:Sodium/hydrogen exchanger family/TrkA-N domain